METFRKEFLAELHIAETQLLALANAVPEEDYGWRPAEEARTFSAVLVHIAVGNLMLLYRTDACAPEVMLLYGAIEGDPVARLVAVIRKNQALEKSVAEKAAVIDLVTKSFEAVRECFRGATEESLRAAQNFWGEPATVRRVYLRMLAHSHEHMGQAIAYARAMGVKAPWPDPLSELDRIAGSAG